MDKLILTNNKEKCLEDLLFEFGENADEIFIASAFFSDTKLLNKWTKLDKTIQLIVSLRFPTSYDSLNEVFKNKNITIRFLGKKFHSKFYVFFKDKKPVACIIGSSNLTGGGLRNNIETNAILTDPTHLNAIVEQISELEKHSPQLLDNNVLEAYEPEYRKSQVMEKNKEPIRDLYTEMKTSNWKNNNSLPDDIIHFNPDVKMLEKFWKSYKKKLHEAADITSNQKPKKYKFDVTIGTHDIYIQNYCLPKKNKVQLALMIKKNPKAVFQFLEERKTNIHKDIGKQLNWNSKLKIKRLELEFETDFNNAEKLNDAINWLVENTIIFYNVFPKYLKNAPRK